MICSIEPPHRSVRPMPPANNVSPEKSCGAGSTILGESLRIAMLAPLTGALIFPGSWGRYSETLPGVWPGV